MLAFFLQFWGILDLPSAHACRAASLKLAKLNVHKIYATVLVKYIQFWNLKIVPTPENDSFWEFLKYGNCEM